MNKSRWTSYEDALLRTLYPDNSRGDIVRRLKNRTWSAVQNRATRLGVKRQEAALFRFLRKIQIQSSGCWYWTDAPNASGYGNFSVHGYEMHAHQYAYVHWKGLVPPGHEIDHKCRNRCCVNPDHLEAVTHRENVIRGNAPPAINANKTHCQHGHEFTEDNTRMNNGHRVCRKCDREYQKQYYLKHRKQ